MSDQNKQQAHWLKAKKGILTQALEAGGSAGMGDLHDFAESQYFIAHQRFSMMMEECVEEGLLLFEDNQFTLTEQGQAYLAGD